MVSVSFYLHSPKENVTPIYILVSPGKHRKSTGISIEPRYWAVKTAKRNGRAIRGKAVQVKRWIKPEHPWSEVLNKRLQEMYNRVWAAFDKAESAGEDLHEIDLPGLIDPKRARVAKLPADRLSVPEVFEDWSKAYSAEKNEGNETDKDKAANYIRRNKQVVGWFEKYRPGILITDIDALVVKGLKKYILKHGKGKGGEGTQDNTVIKHLKALRTLMRFKKLDVSFLTVARETKGTTIDLYWNEVQALRNTDYSRPDIREVVLSFVANCQLCMRFEDMDRATPNHFLHKQSLKHGPVRVVNLNQGKTGDPIFIPAGSLATAILEEFGWSFPIPKGKEYSTRLSYFNDILKEGAKEAKLNRLVRVTNVRNGHVKEKFVPLHEEISSHVARHTGKSRVLEVTKDLLLSDLLLGHSQGDTYSHHNSVQIIDDLLDAWDKIESPGENA